MAKKLISIVVVLVMALAMLTACTDSEMQKRVEELEANAQKQADKIKELEKQLEEKEKLHQGFYTLEKAYEYDWLTKEDIMHISYYMSGYVKEGRPYGKTEVVDFKPETEAPQIDKETENSIKESMARVLTVDSLWQKEIAASDIDILGYYGTYSNCAAIRIGIKGDYNHVQEMQQAVAGIVLYYSSPALLVWNSNSQEEGALSRHKIAAIKVLEAYGMEKNKEFRGDKTVIEWMVMEGKIDIDKASTISEVNTVVDELKSEIDCVVKETHDQTMLQILQHYDMTETKKYFTDLKGYFDGLPSHYSFIYIYIATKSSNEHSEYVESYINNMTFRPVNNTSEMLAKSLIDVTDSKSNYFDGYESSNVYLLDLYREDKQHIYEAVKLLMQLSFIKDIGILWTTND